MCSVVIVELRRSCRVQCECGYESRFVYAPEAPPQCGGDWEDREFKEGTEADFQQPLSEMN